MKASSGRTRRSRFCRRAAELERRVLAREMLDCTAPRVGENWRHAMRMVWSGRRVRRDEGHCWRRVDGACRSIAAGLRIV